MSEKISLDSSDETYLYYQFVFLGRHILYKKSPTQKKMRHSIRNFHQYQ